MAKKKASPFRYYLAFSLLAHLALLLGWRTALLFEPPTEKPSLVLELTPKKIVPPTQGEKKAQHKKATAKKKRSANPAAKSKTKKTITPQPAALVENPLTHQNASQWSTRPTALRTRQKSEKILTLPALDQREVSLLEKQTEASSSEETSLQSSITGPAEKNVSRLKSASSASSAKTQAPQKAENRANRQTSLKGAGGKTQTLNWHHQAPRTLVRYQPLQLPAPLRKKGIKTKALLQFKVNQQGRTYHIVVLKSSGYATLDQALREQVRSFVFNAITEAITYEAELVYALSP